MLRESELLTQMKIQVNQPKEAYKVKLHKYQQYQWLKKLNLCKHKGTLF